MFRAFILALSLSLGVCPALADGVSAPIAISPIGASGAAVRFPPISGGTLPTVTYTADATPSYVGSVATATGVAIGTASSGRLVVVVLTDYFSGGGSGDVISSVTIGGISANIYQGSFNGHTGPFPPFLGLAYANVTIGTTATIVATYSQSSGAGHMEVYALNNLSSFTPVGTGQNWDNSANPISTTLATSSGGVVIVGGACASSGTNAFSGTETYTTDISNADGGFGAVTFGSGHSSGNATNASSTITDTITSCSSHTTIAGVSWR